VLNIRAIAVAGALAAGTVFMAPAASHAMPVAPVKIQTAQDASVVEVNHKKNWRKDRRNWRGDRSRWRGDRSRWRESRNWRRYRYYDRYYDPYYYGPRYGYNGPGYWGGGPGIGFQFRID